jgi:hypothetical protein
MAGSLVHRLFEKLGLFKTVEENTRDDEVVEVTAITAEEEEEAAPLILPVRDIGDGTIVSYRVPNAFREYFENQRNVYADEMTGLMDECIINDMNSDIGRSIVVFAKQRNDDAVVLNDNIVRVLYVRWWLETNTNGFENLAAQFFVGSTIKSWTTTHRKYMQWLALWEAYVAISKQAVQTYEQILAEVTAPIPTTNTMIEVDVGHVSSFSSFSSSSSSSGEIVVSGEVDDEYTDYIQEEEEDAGPSKHLVFDVAADFLSREIDCSALPCIRVTRVEEREFSQEIADRIANGETLPPILSHHAIKDGMLRYFVDHDDPMNGNFYSFVQIHLQRKYVKDRAEDHTAQSNNAELFAAGWVHGFWIRWWIETLECVQINHMERENVAQISGLKILKNLHRFHVVYTAAETQRRIRGVHAEINARFKMESDYYVAQRALSLR